jgi:glycosyltransferase involved in cell wall biosynthesis
LDALALVRDQGFRDAKAIFVGPFDNADYEWGFRAHASRLGLDGAIEMVGFTREVWRWTNEKMSVLIHPSSMEGLPGALVEAMASGLPAIVTDVGAMGRVVREADAGFVVPPEASVIAGRVTQLWRDEAMREKLSAAARDYACNNFDVSSVAQQYLGAVAPARPTQERNFAP